MDRTNNPVEVLAQSFYHCKNKIFHEKIYKKLNVAKYHKDGKEEYYDAVTVTTNDDLEIVGMFVQLWGSTALGFDGIGGAAMTSAYITVIKFVPEKKYAVYFDGRFAYGVINPNAKFFEDLKNKDMNAVEDSKKYE